MFKSKSVLSPVLLYHLRHVFKQIQMMLPYSIFRTNLNSHMQSFVTFSTFE